VRRESPAGQAVERMRFEQNLRPRRLAGEKSGTG
jgi:hypothetical protein